MQIAFYLFVTACIFLMIGYWIGRSGARADAIYTESEFSGAIARAYDYAINLVMDRDKPQALIRLHDMAVFWKSRT